MISRTDLDTVKKLHREIAAILKGQTQPIIGTALVFATADWLRQYHRDDITEPQRDEWRIANLMRFLKGVAEELGLGIEVGQANDDDDLPTFGNA